MSIGESVAERPGTRPVAERHRFDETRLDAWLGQHLPGYEGPLAVRQFAGGQSNPTFHLRAASGEYVLRKKPPGRLLESAHAIDREYRVLEALAGSDVPVPRTRVYCDDAAVVGTPFFVMDYRPGRIFTDPLLPGLARSERTALYDAMNDTLARLHRFDWSGAGLADFGRPAQYVERQLVRWRGQYEGTRVENVPALEELDDWLARHLPPDESASIAHGDFRLGNLIFHEREARVVAILDWELATLGHPLSDLAYNCLVYYLPAGHTVAPGLVGQDLAALGIPAEEDYVAAYARRVGLEEVPHWRFFVAFSLFRVSAIQLGVYARARQGNAASATAQLFGDSYRMVAEAGLNVTRRS